MIYRVISVKPTNVRYEEITILKEQTRDQFLPCSCRRDPPLSSDDRPGTLECGDSGLEDHGS